MTRGALLVSIICATLPAAALGQGMPAKTLYEACDKAAPDTRLVCSFYILGVADGVMVQHARRARETPGIFDAAREQIFLPYCLPEGINGNEIVNAMVTRMRAEPRPSEPAGEQIRRHLATAFPCP